MRPHLSGHSCSRPPTNWATSVFTSEDPLTLAITRGRREASTGGFMALLGLVFMAVLTNATRFHGSWDSMEPESTLAECRGG